jgi:hypothetical protein
LFLSCVAGVLLYNQLLYNNTPAAHDRNKNYNNYYIAILQQHMTGTTTTTIIICIAI